MGTAAGDQSDMNGDDAGRADMTVAVQIVMHGQDAAGVVRIVGDVDLATATQLRATLETALSAYPQVIVDLSHACVVDSVGLSVLVTARRTARLRGGDLLLAALSPRLRSVLHAARLSSAFITFDTVPQAMTAALSKAAPVQPGAARARRADRVGGR